uniref:SART-1 family, putative n=1 Tax=Theileria annulata TaxID=5874 RepID=A0A3B0MZL9_THEAN
MPASNDSTISCSIEETNEIRKKLGLKPLAVPTSEPQNESEQPSQDTEEVIERLNKSKRRRAREALIKEGSIADSIKKGEPINSKCNKLVDNSENVDTLDLLSWSKKMAKVTKSTIAQADKHVTYSDDEESDEPNENNHEPKEETNGPKLKVIHKVNELDLIKGDGVTLTLKDVGVLEAEAAGVSDLDFLENAELVDMKKDKKKMEQRMRNQYGNYVPYEEDDPLNTGFLKHYDDTIKETQGTKLSSLANEDEGFFVKPNQSRKFQVNFDENENYDSFIKKTKPSATKTELVDETDVFSTLSSRKEKLKKKPKQMNWDKIFSKDENIELDLNNLVPTKIKKDVAVVDDEDEEMLYIQISNHRKRVSNTEVKNEDSKDVKPHVDFGASINDKKFEITTTTEFCKVVKTPMEKISEQESDQKYNVNTASDLVVDDDPNTLSERPLGDGISAALSYIKQRGDYIDKKAETRSKEVQLNYIDEYGNEMTPKEAFKKISWIFHGKRPSKKKQEKMRRKIELGILNRHFKRSVNQNPVGALPTMKALFTHQEKEQTPHITLFGNRNLN